MRVSKIFLRRAELKDSELVLAWRNDAEAIRQSVSGLAVATEVHQQWFARAVESPATMLLIADAAMKDGTRSVGMCRFDRAKDGVFAVSINLGPDFRGRGLGRVVLQSGIAFLKTEVSEPVALEAVVHESNLVSRHVFEGVGFSVFGHEGPWVRLRMEIKSA